MPTEFTVSDERLDSTTHVVSVRGEVDLFTAPEFKNHIVAAIDAGRALVIIDLSETTFIDSSSLGVLISAQRRLAGRDGRLVVVSEVEAVLNTFRITGLDSVIEVLATREEALAPAA
jgi:anti-sigma B factor antagonist